MKRQWPCSIRGSAEASKAVILDVERPVGISNGSLPQVGMIGCTRGSDILDPSCLPEIWRVCPVSTPSGPCHPGPRKHQARPRLCGDIEWAADPRAKNRLGTRTTCGSLSPLGSGDDRVDFAAAAFRAHQPLAPNQARSSRRHSAAPVRRDRVRPGGAVFVAPLLQGGLAA
jgi:hypothetical protein